IDLFLNFPIMDINRNVLRHDRRQVAANDIERMNRFWGDNSWCDVAYVDTGQTSMFDFEPEKQKQDNETIVAAFRARLQKVAGFEYVPQPLAMTNSNNAVVYYLFFASDNDTGRKIITDIFGRYRLQRA
ncbi:MAG TPA: three-Cys-motif partner protein TcmP, partial [Rhodospirillales bacterium]|nr:three-Cys-motif partner protein TcmP [Rhodospirillales bacterium]